MNLAHFTTLDLALLGLAGVLVGISKTALSGVGALTAAVFASVLPARASTGALLPLLIFGDVIALAMYRRSAHWPSLARVAAPVAVGVGLGVVFVALAQDAAMRRTIGAVLLGLLIGHLLFSRRRGSSGEPVEHGAIAHWTYGGLGGFATMVANSAGPVMSLYLLGSKLDKLTFLGTMAWFFAAVNLFKLPFSIGLGLVTRQSLLLNLALAPLVLAGGLAGRWLVQRINQRTFEVLVTLLTAGSALNLLR